MHACMYACLLEALKPWDRSSAFVASAHTYIHTSPASPERLALSLEHVDHDDLVDVDARVRVELGHVCACVSPLSS